MNKIRILIISSFAILGLIALPLPLAHAACDKDSSPADCIKQGTSDIGGDKTDDKALEDGIKTIVNMMLFLLGAIAVVMIVIGGIRYSTSNGDASATKGAKDTILYAVVGLVVAILAYAIVNFVLGAFSGAK
ncbi:MAG: pilin [Candidatus Saccharimonadales bacterium]